VAPGIDLDRGRGDRAFPLLYETGMEPLFDEVLTVIGRRRRSARRGSPSAATQARGPARSVRSPRDRKGQDVRSTSFARGNDRDLERELAAITRRAVGQAGALQRALERAESRGAAAPSAGALRSGGPQEGIAVRRRRDDRRAWLSRSFFSGEDLISRVTAAAQDEDVIRHQARRTLPADLIAKRSYNPNRGLRDRLLGGG